MIINNKNNFGLSYLDALHPTHFCKQFHIMRLWGAQFYTLLFFFVTICISHLSYASKSDSTPLMDMATKMSTLQNGFQLKKILERGVLRVAMHKKDHSPYLMTDDTGNVIGIDADLAREIGRQLGVKIQFIRTKNTFDEVVKLVIDDKADVAISKLSLTLHRAKKVLYTKPYSSLSKSILVNRKQLLRAGKQNSVKEMFSKKDATIGAIKGSSYVAFAKRIFPNATIYESDDWYGDILPKLFAGELWGAFRDEIEVRRSIFLSKDASLFVLAVNLEDEQDPFMMVTNKNASMFRDWLDLFLEFVYKEVPFSEALEKYKQYVYRLSPEEQSSLKAKNLVVPSSLFARPKQNEFKSTQNHQEISKARGETS